jgi:hypothetical protein
MTGAQMTSAMAGKTLDDIVHIQYGSKTKVFRDFYPGTQMTLDTANELIRCSDANGNEVFVGEFALIEHILFKPAERVS